MGFPCGSAVKNTPAVQETQVRSLSREAPPGGGHGNPLQYSSLENPINSAAWLTTVHRVAKRQTQLKCWAHGHTRTYCGFADRPGTQSREPGRSGRPRLRQQGQRASHSQGCSPRPPRAVSKFIHSPQWVRAWTRCE